MELFDFLNDINYRKTSAMKDNPDCERFYEPYKVNKFLAQNFDSVMYVNEMNFRPHCDKKLQYEYFMDSLGVDPTDQSIYDITFNSSLESLEMILIKIRRYIKSNLESNFSRL